MNEGYNLLKITHNQKDDLDNIHSAEACEAGLEPQVLQEWLKEVNEHEEDALFDLLHKEVQEWTYNCIDVDVLQRRALHAEETCRILNKKILFLQMQLEKQNNCNFEKPNKSGSTILITAKSPKISLNAEDEGISFSERSSNAETKHQINVNCQQTSPVQSNDQETTIDDVIEELRIIVKDAEDELSDKIQKLNHRTNINQEISYNMHESDKEKLYRSNSKISLNNSENYLHDKISKKDKYIDLRLLKSNADSNTSHQNQMRGEQVTYFGNDQDYNMVSSAIKRLTINRPRKMSKSLIEDGVKILVKGPDMEEVIVPSILHPQPPRRTPPCLSTIMIARHCDFINHAEIFNSYDDEMEEETLADGSDSLLSASRLKYNGKHQEYEEQMKNIDSDQLQKQTKNNTDMLIGLNQIDTKFRKSFDDLCRYKESNEKEKKTLRSYENSIGSKSKIISDVKFINEQVDVYQNLESNPKGFDTSSEKSTDHRTIYRHSSRHISEMEKRKYLRRSSSHDYLESNISSLQSRQSGSKVEYRIRKFESLNSFDEHRSLQNYGRLDDTGNLDKREQMLLLPDTSRSKMRRSESFHHVSYVSKKDQYTSKGGGDNDLFYLTDFKSTDMSIPNLTKSLDKIDEGLDLMADVVKQKKNQWNGSKRPSKANKSKDKTQLIRSKSVRLNDFCSNSFEFDKQMKRENATFKNKHLKSDKLYHINNKQLRNDEFYEKQRTREWDNELNYMRSKSDVSSEDSSMTLLKNTIKPNSFCQRDKINNKFSKTSKESRIFVGRTYDIFGFGKGYFNAGKYFGNQQIRENSIDRRNTTSSVIRKRGKVTDVISGLY